MALVLPLLNEDIPAPSTVSREREREKERDRDRERQRDREGGRERQRERDRERDNKSTTSNNLLFLTKLCHKIKSHRDTKGWAHAAAHIPKTIMIL